MIAERKTVGWLRGTAAGVLTLLLTFAAYLPAFLAADAVSSSEESLVAAVVLCAVLALGSAAALRVGLEVAFTGRVRDLAQFGLRLPRRLFSSLGIYVPLTIAAAVVGGILTVAAGLDDEPTTEINTEDKSDAERLFVSFAAIVIAPWVEELVFRGMIFGALAGRFGFWPAALFSSLAWSSLHLALGVVILFTLEGMVLCWLRRRTGSVLPGVGVHGAWNCLATGLSGAGWFAPASLLLFSVSLVAAAFWMRRA